MSDTLDLSIVTPDDVETQVLEWGQFQWINCPKVTNTQNMAVGIGRIAPGFGHERHQHVGSEEFIYFLEGKARQTVERPDGTVEKIMEPGDLVSIKDSQWHSTINVGDTDCVFLCCYLHAGPEEDIKKDALKIIPPKNAR